MNLPLFEYYDGYEHIWSELPEEEREKVQYVVLGKTSYGVVVCYVGSEHSFVTVIGEMTHKKAWSKGEISAEEVRATLEKERAYSSIPELDRKIAELAAQKETLDAKHNIRQPRYSASSSEGFAWRYGDSYTEQFIQTLLKKKEMLTVRDTFYNQNVATKKK